MKKTILVTILVAVMLLAAIGSVNAASVAPSKDTIKAGETVTVTVKPTKAGVNLQFDVEFNPEVLEFKGVTSTTGMTAKAGESVKTTGKGTIMVYDAAGEGTKTDFATLTFKALKDVNAAEVKVTNLVSEDEELATVGTATVKVEKADETKEPSGSKDPDKKPDDTKNPTDVNGKPITTHPKTGAPVYMVAIAVIVIAAGAVLAVRKSK